MVKSSFFRSNLRQLLAICCFLLWQNSSLANGLLSANWCAKQYHLNNLKIAQAKGFHYQLGLASKKDWPVLASILEKGLASRTPRERDDIFLLWKENPLEKTVVETYIIWILAAVLGLLGVFTISIISMG